MTFTDITGTGTLPYRQDTERAFKDVTAEYERMRCELMLIRVALGLNPAHDVLTAVRTLHDEGREALEKLRGEKCEYAHQWAPR